jgi:hypothetical protein
MTPIASIVEGDGEVTALPVLLRRIGAWLSPQKIIDLPPPIRVRRDRFINREDEFRKYLLLAAAKSTALGWVLILLDADDDCPAELGAKLLQKAKNIIPHRHVSIVLASREYEAWFIAAARSLHGYRGFVFDQPIDAETPRNAAGWVNQHMPERSYGKIADQPAFSAHMDLQQAFDGSRSFRKLCNEWKKQMSDE